jgi:hypothetical protein
MSSPGGQVFDIGRGTGTMITGLEYFRLRSAVEGQSVFGVLVTTMTKLYQFQGNLVNRMEDRPLLQSIFNAYLNVKGKFSAKI